MKTLQIIDDYKTLAIPLDMIARKNKVSLHQCIVILHRAITKMSKNIEESKLILKEIECMNKCLN